MMPWQLEVAQRWISEDFSALPVWGVSSGRCNCGKPCERDAGKHPIGYLAPNGLNDATRDLDLVEHWVAREPNMNLGLVPGPTRFVADIDGELALEELEMLGCVEEVLDTLQVQSSGPDRVHIVLGKGPSDPVPPSAKKLGAHIDIRGPGSYIVAEGSTHISGARYRIIADQLIKQAPRWLLDHLAALSRNGTTKAHDNGGSADGIELRAFVAAGLDFGTRDDYAFKYACSLRGRGFTIEDARLTMEGAWGRMAQRDTDVYSLTTALAKVDRAFANYEPNPKTYHYTDYGNAERFRERHGAELTYVKDWVSWLSWDGSRWAKDRTFEAEQRGMRIMRDMFAEAVELDDKERRDSLLKWAKASESTKSITAMMTAAARLMAVDSALFDADPLVLNTRTGVVDLRTGQLRAHSKDDLFTKVTNGEFKPGMRSEVWQAFLDRIQPDPTMQRYPPPTRGDDVPLRDSAVSPLAGDPLQGLVYPRITRKASELLLDRLALTRL